MEKAGIGNDDLLVVDKSLKAKNNDIVIAVVNGEFTVKRYIDLDGKICLRAETEISDYPDIGRRVQCYPGAWVPIVLFLRV